MVILSLLCCDLTHLEMLMRIFQVLAVVVTYVVGAGPESTRGKYGQNPELRKRDGMVRAALLEHPQWTARQVMDVVAPQLAAAGLKPISYRLLCHQLVLLGKEIGVDRRLKVMTPEQLAYLRAMYTKNPLQSFASVVATFQAAWGTDALSRRQINNWWGNYRRRSGNRNDAPLRLPVAIRMTPAPPVDDGSEEHPILL